VKEEYFQYRDNELFIENINLYKLAQQCGTPCYVYSRATLEKNWADINQAFSTQPHEVCYAVKANSNLTILNLFANLGAGFDIVSYGELERVIAAGGDARKIIFSGVGKQHHEIAQAIHRGIQCFNVETAQELSHIHTIAHHYNKKINIALRINPDIDANTHPYIATGLRENKFGISLDQVIPLAKTILNMPFLNLIGIAIHIGSQITSLAPFQAAIEQLLAIYQQLHAIGITVSHINVGGGIGVRYHDEQPFKIDDYATMINSKLRHHPVTLLLEPGRWLMADAGVLLTEIAYLKKTHHKNFAIVDAGMNDILRPALYQAWQDIKPVIRRISEPQLYDIVGPLCESADFLGKERWLMINEGDYLAVCDVGAYGFSMSSNYNSRCRAAEILVDKDEIHIIRRRECIEDLLAQEGILLNEWLEIRK